jgi:hypothetical protein
MDLCIPMATPHVRRPFNDTNMLVLAANVLTYAHRHSKLALSEPSMLITHAHYLKERMHLLIVIAFIPGSQNPVEEWSIDGCHLQ